MTAKSDDVLIDQQTLTNQGSQGTGKYRSLPILVALVALFAAAIVGALQQQIGDFSRPGPGLWPLLASALGLVVTGVAFVEMFVRGFSATESELGSIDWVRFSLFFIFTFGFLLAYNVVGFLVSGALMMFLMFMFVARVGWKTSLVVALVATGGLYFIFAELLNVRM